MVTRSQKIRLGIFVVVSLSALLITIAVILAPKLFEKRDVYYIGYENISLTGLQRGGPVKYHGLTVGSVSDIRIDKEDISRVIVEVSLSHGTPIKQNTRADIELLGITGIKVIELRGGTHEAPYLKPGGSIEPGKSITELITGQAEGMLEKAELTLYNISQMTTPENRQKLMGLIDNTSLAMAQFNDILRKNNQALSQSIHSMAEITSDLQELVVGASQTMRHVAAISGSDTLRRVVTNLADITESLRRAELTRLVHEMNETLAHTGLVLQEIDATISKNRSDVGYAVQSMKESVEYLNQFSRMITEDPSVLIRGAEPKNAPDFKLEK